MRLNALKVAVLLERLAERGEGLVHRVGWDGADGAAEDIRLDQPNRGLKISGAEHAVRVVVIQFEQEWVGDIDLQLAQVMEGLAQRGVLLVTQAPWRRSSGRTCGSLSPVPQCLLPCTGSVRE